MTWRLQGPSQIIEKDETLKVRRQGSSVPKNVSYVDGKPVKRTEFDFEITCNVQPLNGRDLLILPEADRFKEQYWVFMNQQEKPLLVNDIVVRFQEGQLVNFQVQSAENWGSYTRARIMRIDVGPNATA